MTSFRFSTHWRLRRREDFRRVFATRCSVADRHVVIYIAPNTLQFNRLGLSVGRRFGGAVVRNRFKRLVREAFRQRRIAQLCPGHDLVCIPRPGAPRALSTYMNSLERLVQRGVERLAQSPPRRAAGDG